MTAGSAPGTCQWIDHSGFEWHFRRTPEALIVSRPNGRGSVAVRFADMAGADVANDALETWVQLETEDGKVIRCGLSSNPRSHSASEPSGPASKTVPCKRFVETWLDVPKPADGTRVAR